MLKIKHTHTRGRKEQKKEKKRKEGRKEEKGNRKC